MAEPQTSTGGGTSAPKTATEESAPKKDTKPRKTYRAKIHTPKG